MLLFYSGADRLRRVLGDFDDFGIGRDESPGQIDGISKGGAEPVRAFHPLCHQLRCKPFPEIVRYQARDEFLGWRGTSAVTLRNLDELRDLL